MQLKNRNWLFTGATGFIGRSLLLKLVELLPINDEKVNIVVISRSIKAITALKKVVGNRANIIAINDDILNISTLPHDNYEYVIHAASPGSKDRFSNLNSDLENFEVTFLGTKKILDFSRDCFFGKLLFLSSGAIYGDSVRILHSEDSPYANSPLHSFSNYAEAKRASETLINLYSRQYRFNWAVARIFAVIGEEMYLEENSGYIFSGFVRSTLHNQPLVINGNPESERSFIDIDDCVRYLQAILIDDVSHRVFNIGSVNPMSMMGLAQLFNEVSGKDLPIIASNLDGAASYMCSNIERAINTFGFQPLVPLSKSISKIINSKNENTINSNSNI